MALTPKLLASGQAAITKSVVYTAPMGQRGYVKRFSAYNTNAATQTVIVYYTPYGGTSIVIDRAVLLQNERWEADVPFLVGPGDALEMVTTTATALDYGIWGAEG